MREALKAELSIVVPVYNVGQGLNSCLESIQRQTFTAWECILVDDGSTDLSGRMCDGFGKQDSRFRVIHQRNAGVSSARNVGTEVASAPLLAFVDPDDFIPENYFELLVSELRRVDADLASSNFYMVEENGDEGIYWMTNRLNQNSRCEFIGNAAIVKAVSENFFSCVCWGKVYRRDLWGAARFPVGINLGEDMMTVPGVIVKAKSAVLVDGAKYYYRNRQKSLLHGTVSRRRYQQDLQASAFMLRQFREFAPERERDFSKLKLWYDIGCLTAYLRSNSGENRAEIFVDAAIDILTSFREHDSDLE